MTPSTRLSVSLLLIAVVWPICAAGQQVNPQVAGQWVMTTDVFGNPLHQTLTLKLEGTAVSGTLYDGDRTEISGTLNGNVIRFATKEEHAGAPSEYEGTIAGDEMSGNARVFGDRPDERLPVKWTARRMPPAPSGPPRRHEFVPTVFHRAFSAYNAPVLHIKSGDTVHTATVDAGGFDDKGVPRVLGGNPETGPFYVDGALPGDTLIVRLLQVRLNRDWASSDDALVPRALSAGIAEPMRYEPKGVRWKLDRERNLAAPAEPSEHLKKYVVPVKPMLGCVATAPGFASQPVSAGDSGRWGAIWISTKWVKVPPCICRSTSPAHCSMWATAMRCKATAS
jgi:amidase